MLLPEPLVHLLGPKGGFAPFGKKGAEFVLRKTADVGFFGHGPTNLVFFDEALRIGVVHQFGSAFAGQLFQDVFAVRIDGVVA